MQEVVREQGKKICYDVMSAYFYCYCYFTTATTTTGFVTIPHHEMIMMGMRYIYLYAMGKRHDSLLWTKVVSQLCSVFSLTLSLPFAFTKHLATVLMLRMMLLRKIYIQMGGGISTIISVFNVYIIIFLVYLNVSTQSLD